MQNALEKIARENFRAAGYLSDPDRKDRTPWTFAEPPQVRFNRPEVAQRVAHKRASAYQKKNHRKLPSLRAILDAYFH
ncbi:MAG: hypothetical protein ACLFUF_00040 [Opitutales bacterium]